MTLTERVDGEEGKEKKKNRGRDIKTKICVRRVRPTFASQSNITSPIPPLPYANRSRTLSRTIQQLR